MMPAPVAGRLQGITLLLPVSVTVLGVVVLLPVMPAMAVQFASVPGIAFWLPVLLTIPSFMVVIFAGVAGLLADMMGRKRLLLGAMLAYAATGLAPLFLHSFFAILATRIGVGICEAGVLVVTTTMIGDYFSGAARERWIGGQIGVATVAATILVMLGGMLGGALGWRGPFLIYALPLPLALMAYMFLWEPQPEVSDAPRHAATNWQGFPWQRMALICGMTVFASFLFYLVQIELSFALALHGIVDPRRTGQMLAIISIGTIAGSLLFRFVSRQKLARLLCGELLVLGLGLIGMSLAQTYQPLVGFALFTQIGAGLILPTLLSWAVRELPFEHRGRGTGMWQGTFSVGQFIVSISIPAVNVLTGGLLASFHAIGLATLAAAAIAGAMMLRRAPRATLHA